MCRVLGFGDRDKLALHRRVTGSALDPGFARTSARPAQIRSFVHIKRRKTAIGKADPRMPQGCRDIIDQQSGLKRTMHDKVWIVLDILGVGTVVMDAVGIECQSRVAEQHYTVGPERPASPLLPTR